MEGDEAMMYHEDRLMEVSDKHMQSNPFKNVGLIEIITGGNADAHGTGTLISPNLVLTCAHIIYNQNYPRHSKDPTKNHLAKYLRFYPGHSGELNNPYEVEKYFVPK
jgi:V8-like Glu-specific endopeptidase